MYIALGIGECHKCPRSIFVLMLVGTIWTVSQRSSNQTPTLFIVLPDLKYTLQNVLAVSDSDYMIQTHPLSLFLPLAMWMPGKEGSWTSKINKNVFSSLVSHPNLPPPNLLLDRSSLQHLERLWPKTAQATFNLSFTSKNISTFWRKGAYGLRKKYNSDSLRVWPMSFSTQGT